MTLEEFSDFIGIDQTIILFKYPFGKTERELYIGHNSDVGRLIFNYEKFEVLTVYAKEDKLYIGISEWTTI